MNPLHPFPNGRSTSTEARPASRPPHQTNETPLPKVTPPQPGSAEPASSDQTGRDNGGRFTKGNKGGPGNPFARKSAALRQALLDTVTAEDLQAIVRQMIQQAKEGDVSAARLVFSYTLGKPDKAVDPDTLDTQEFQQLQNSYVPNEDFLRVVGGLQAPLACAILRLVLPIIQDQTAQDLGKKMREPIPDPATEPDELEDETGPSEAAQWTSAEPLQVQNSAAARSTPKRQRAAGKAARGESRSTPASASGPQAGSTDQAFLAQEQASWLAFIKEIMDSNGLDPGASADGPNDP